MKKEGLLIILLLIISLSGCTTPVDDSPKLNVIEPTEIQEPPLEEIDILPSHKWRGFPTREVKTLA